MYLVPPLPFFWGYKNKTSVSVGSRFSRYPYTGRNTAAVAALCEVGARVTPEVPGGIHGRDVVEFYGS